VELLCTVVMCRAYGVVVPIRHMTIRAMLWVHSPWTLVGAMIHRWWLRFDVCTDTGSGALWLWLSNRLRSGGCPVGRDVVLGNAHGRRAADAMRALTG
jgi:hypothetical protein